MVWWVRCYQLEEHMSDILRDTHSVILSDVAAVRLEMLKLLHSNPLASTKYRTLYPTWLVQWGDG